jgi:hypothetical protein
MAVNILFQAEVLVLVGAAHRLVRGIQLLDIVFTGRRAQNP